MSSIISVLTFDLTTIIKSDDKNQNVPSLIKLKDDLFTCRNDNVSSYEYYSKIEDNINYNIIVNGINYIFDNKDIVNKQDIVTVERIPNVPTHYTFEEISERYFVDLTYMIAIYHDLNSMKKKSLFEIVHRTKNIIDKIEYNTHTPSTLISLVSIILRFNKNFAAVLESYDESVLQNPVNPVNPKKSTNYCACPNCNKKTKSIIDSYNNEIDKNELTSIETLVKVKSTLEAISRMNDRISIENKTIDNSTIQNDINNSIKLLYNNLNELTNKTNYVIENEHNIDMNYINAVWK